MRYSGDVRRYPAADLAASLAANDASQYVRLVADWLTRGHVDEFEPPLTGHPVPDALVAAAVAFRCTTRGEPSPEWTSQPDRQLATFWHPGNERFFAYSLAHTPADFLLRGLVVERDSLESV